MYYPKLEEAKKLKESYTHIPIVHEIYSDFKTPISLINCIRLESDKFFLLESVEGDKKWSRYSFIGFNPSLSIQCNKGIVTINENGVKTISTENPTNRIRTILSKYNAPKFDYLPPFTGGLVGYFSYDFIKYCEDIDLVEDNEHDFLDLNLHLFEKVIVFDHQKQKLMFISNVKTENLESNYSTATTEIQELVALIDKNAPLPPNIPSPSEFISNMTKEEFEEKVLKVKEHIIDGDIFQLVLSQRFKADYEGDLFNIYRVLRTATPSPYMYYIKLDEMEVAGSSPETLVKLENGVVHTVPIAGTRQRGKTEAEDMSLEKELLADEKELAEHNMLVDLGRNDIGKVSEFGSVTVPQYLAINKFSHVMHITSLVEGRLRKELDCLDAIASILPAGTLSGAPKLKAVEIINNLEQQKRGPYGGAIGYIDFSGNMDMCILIRSIINKSNQLFIQAGAGIVADSIPENEYFETLNKAKALFNAIEIASKGI